jgi:hypothetical protein
MLTLVGGGWHRRSGNGEAARLASGVNVRGLRWCSSLKNRMRTFLAAPSFLLDRPNCSKRWQKIEFKSHLGFGMFFNLLTKFKHDSLVFIGVFARTHRGLGELTNLSISRLQIVKGTEDLALG